MTTQGKQFFKTVLTVIIFLCSTGAKKTDLPVRDAARLMLGISGHPLNTFAYNANPVTNPGVSYDTQVAMLKEMGLRIYRMDVLTKPSGESVNHSKFLDILGKCRRQGITVLPMVYDRCRYEGTPEEAYAEGFRQMAGFAKLYGYYLEYVELGNEIELFDKLRKRKTGPGTHESHYYMERVLIAEQYIRGMEDGLKSVLPAVKSMVNTAGYLPVFWMDRMFAAAPTIDICAWHIYSEMPPYYEKNFGITNIHEYLFERYGRPIWYTETNARARADKTQEQNEERSYKWRRSFTASCMANPNVKAIVYHELLDNPEKGGLKKPNYEEEHFGFVKFDGYPGKKDADAYLAWKADPDRYQKWSYKKNALDLIGRTSLTGTRRSE